MCQFSIFLIQRLQQKFDDYEDYHRGMFGCGCVGVVIRIMHLLPRGCELKSHIRSVVARIVQPFGLWICIRMNIYI